MQMEGVGVAGSPPQRFRRTVQVPVQVHEAPRSKTSVDDGQLEESDESKPKLASLPARPASTLGGDPELASGVAAPHSLARAAASESQLAASVVSLGDPLGSKVDPLGKPPALPTHVRYA
jgi:hypothetical protein